MRLAEGVGLSSLSPFSARIYSRVLPGRAWAEGQARRSLSVILGLKNDVRDNFVIRIMILGKVVYV